MKTNTRKTKAPAPFKPGALILRKGDGIALRFQFVNETGNVFAQGSTYDEQPAGTLHDLGADLSRIVEIAEVVTLPNGLRIGTQSRAALAELVREAEKHFRASAQAWEARQTRTTPERYTYLEAKEQREADKGAALLAPLGIKCDWPGLYPSFTVHGYGEHSTESAVCAAVGLPRNALRAYLGGKA